MVDKTVMDWCWVEKMVLGWFNRLCFVLAVAIEGCFQLEGGCIQRRFDGVRILEWACVLIAVEVNHP